MPKFLPGHEQRPTPDPYTGGLVERRPPARPCGARVGGLSVLSPPVYGPGQRHKNDFAHALKFLRASRGLGANSKAGARMRYNRKYEAFSLSSNLLAGPI